MWRSHRNEGHAAYSRQKEKRFCVDSNNWAGPESRVNLTNPHFETVQRKCRLRVMNEAGVIIVMSRPASRLSDASRTKSVL